MLFLLLLFTSTKEVLFFLIIFYLNVQESHYKKALKKSIPYFAEYDMEILFSDNATLIEPGSSWVNRDTHE